MASLPKISGSGWFQVVREELAERSLIDRKVGRVYKDGGCGFQLATLSFCPEIADSKGC